VVIGDKDDGAFREIFGWDPVDGVEGFADGSADHSADLPPDKPLLLPAHSLSVS
jgi:hypothetical protein